MQSNAKTEMCESSKKLGTFCSIDDTQPSDTCFGEEGSGIVCNGILRGIVSRDCEQGNGQIQYTDVSQTFNWIWLSHLDGTLKMIDNEMLRNFVFSILDIVAYYIGTPKIADDFEMIKFIF